MSNVHFAAFRNQLAHGGEPPDNGDMHTRVTKLESLAEKTGERLGAIDVRLERIETKVDQLATKEALALTKADLHKTINDQTWKIITWMTGISTGLVAATFFVAKFVK